MKNRDRKVAVVTGAASGIGMAMAAAFLNQGMKVVLADIEEEALSHSVTSSNQQYPAKCLGVPTDVAQSESVQNLAEGRNDEVLLASASYRCQ